MDKSELISITLDRLIDRFELSPESFEYSENSFPTIVWRPKIQLEDITSVPIHDPNNAHIVVVRWNSCYQQMECFLFLSIPLLEPVHCLEKADSSITVRRSFERYRGNYRKLMRLKNKIRERNTKKINITYMRKLSSIFPDAFDCKLFK